MSAEKEMILRAMPDMIQAEVLDYLRDEVQKGCNSRVFPFPVALEPPYSPLCNQNKLPNRAPYADIIAEEIPRIDDLLRLQVWLSPYEEFVWLNAELFLKQLSAIRRIFISAFWSIRTILLFWKQAAWEYSTNVSCRRYPLFDHLKKLANPG
jgi:hypothetical protein